MRWRRLGTAVLLVMVPMLHGCFGEHVVRATSRVDTPTTELATIRGALGGEWDAAAVIFIVEVDGVSVRKGGWIWNRVSEVVVDPGVHVIGITAKFGDNANSAVVPVKITADAGRVYEIRGATVESESAHSLVDLFTMRRRWAVWVVDLASGAVVVGTKPQ